ncbi:hypothetical protein IV203_030271 [Nitzschia inconspicua]|uniref:Uncharacterized protein n=1 Tax=Nitzschia inconspicua TaxID=303405 RepID=A0A9K3Q219_9STRA|nr:hypothetical protein IV203_030271 [Nitzschia inconspicua]
MASSFTDFDDQECKCYKVLSTKPIPNKAQVFDSLASFLRKDKERQLNSFQIGDDSDNDDDEEEMEDDGKQSNVWGRDLVREKATWNELRRWANELLLEDGSRSTKDTGKGKRERTPIAEWTKKKRARSRSDVDEEGDKSDGTGNDKDVDSTNGSPVKNKVGMNAHDDRRITSTGMIKVETIESTGRAEVVIVGRSAEESFEDHVQSDMDDIEEARKKLETKEAKKARKKEKKDAKKAKKEAKKMAKREKKESKKRHRDETPVKEEG